MNLQESLAELGRVLSYPDFVDRAFAEGSPHRVDMLRIFLEAHIDEDCPATVQTGFLILFRNTTSIPCKDMKIFLAQQSSSRSVDGVDAGSCTLLESASRLDCAPLPGGPLGPPVPVAP